MTVSELLLSLGLGAGALVSWALLVRISRWPGDTGERKFFKWIAGFVVALPALIVCGLLFLASVLPSDFMSHTGQNSSSSLLNVIAAKCQAAPREAHCEYLKTRKSEGQGGTYLMVTDCDVYGVDSIVTMEQTCRLGRGGAFTTSFEEIFVAPMPPKMRAERDLVEECRGELSRRGCPYERTEFAMGEGRAFYLNGICYARKKALFSDSHLFRVNGFHCTRTETGGLYLDFFRPNISRDPDETSQTPFLSDEILLW